MSSFTRLITFKIFVSLLIMTISSCYPMPKDGEYSMIPTTNNPDVVGSHGGNELMPGAGF